MLGSERINFPLTAYIRKVTTMLKKICTKCALEKPINQFGKRGKKRSAQCKECVNNYLKNWKTNKKRNKLHNTKIKPLENSEIKDGPIFDGKRLFSKAKELSDSDLIEKVQKIQMLPGEASSYVKITCPCSNTMKLSYKHSFDAQNDYYEEQCLNCNKLFKLTITTTS
jgi:hypothetical protein